MALPGIDNTAYRRESCEHWNQEKHGPLSQPPADHACDRSDGDVAGMVIGRVATHPPRQLPHCKESECQGRDGRSEHITNDRPDGIGREDRAKRRPRKDHYGGYGEYGSAITTTPRLARVASIAAPAGICAASPTSPLMVVINPTEG